MALPPVTLSSDPMKALNLDSLDTPVVDTFDDKSDDPLSDARDRSTSPSSDTAEPPATKEWPLLSFEKYVQNWLKSNDVAGIIGNEEAIMEKYQDYKKDYELVKPILDTLTRFHVDNHETIHQMAHGMLKNLSLGHTLLTLNPAWVTREEDRAAAAALAKGEQNRKRVEKEKKKAEEGRKKADVEAKAKAKVAIDLLAKVDLTIAIAKAKAKSKRKSVATPAVEKTDDKAATSASDSAGSATKSAHAKSADKINDKAAEETSDGPSATKKAEKKLVPYIPKYMLDVHLRKYCMNDALVTRGSVGDPSIVSCLAASASKAQARIKARNSKTVGGGRLRATIYESRAAKRVGGGGWEMDEEGKLVVTAEGVVRDLKDVEVSYLGGIGGMVQEVIEAMMRM